MHRFDLAKRASYTRRGGIPKARREAMEIQPRIEAQREHRGFARWIGLIVDGPRHPGVDARDVCAQVGRVRRTRTRKMRVRARPDAEPVAIAPVPEVVERTLPRPGPVRDLVMAVSGATERALRHPVHPGDTGVVRLGESRGAAPPLEDRPPAAGPVRDGPVGVKPQLEGVARHMVGREPDSDLQVALPGRDRLTRPAEDQIEIDVESSLLGHLERGRAVVRLVRPPKRAQAARVEALCAERETGEPEGEPGLEARPVERRRVRLERHLSRAKGEGGTERLAEPCDLRGLEQAGRPATEEERPHPWAAEQLALTGYLAPERIQIAPAKRGRGGRGREVAVGAARGAEGNVHVEAKAKPWPHTSLRRGGGRGPRGAKRPPATPDHRVTASGFGSSASEDSSAVRPRSMSHSRDS